MTSIRPFRRVQTHYSVKGSTVVEWEIEPAFSDRLPHVFQLEVSNSGIVTADDWNGVGSSVETNYAVDDAPRSFGKTLEAHYRIKLTTPDGLYYSDLASPLSGQDFRDWRLWREILRKEKLHHFRGLSIRGFLFRARRYGKPCTCIDPLTKEPKRPSCKLCFETGFLNGYFAPLPDFYVNRDPETAREHIDPQQTLGTVREPLTVKGRALGEPTILSRDVFVEKETDKRWMFHTISVAAALRGRALILNCELRELPLTHPVYGLKVS